MMRRGEVEEEESINSGGFFLIAVSIKVFILCKNNVVDVDVDDSYC